MIDSLFDAPSGYVALSTSRAHLLLGAPALLGGVELGAERLSK